MTTSTTPPLDQAVRDRIATDTLSTLFVEAGAGSGKTTALIQRLLALVLDDGIPLSRIAAVTFTEKAGAELRDRLRAELDQESARAGAERQALARAATAELDGAAIGTLHSFAQRILTMFPIQAELPPLIEVLDEVASSVAFDARWSVLQQELLEEEALADHVILALSAKVKLEHLRSLARALGNDWDLIADRIPLEAPEPVAVEGLEGLAAEAADLAARATECTDDDDKFLPRLEKLGEWARLLDAAGSDPERFALLFDAESLKWGHGRKGSWPDLAGLKEECQDLQRRANELAQDLADATLKPLAQWIAWRVHHSARVRMDEGRLEFHDLLVLTRNLLRTKPDVRQALKEQYPRLLLDEFQDTDPIQIELAVRIAAGAEGNDDDWTGIAVPEGSLFVVGDPKQSIYRFRRASISTYLRAQGCLGETATLSTNFRTVPPILDWVNTVFGRLISFEQNVQPAFTPLDAHRAPGGQGPAVVVLGAEEHQDKQNAEQLRIHEAGDVAAVIRQALSERWEVGRGETKRPVRAGDIAVLVPARTSLPFLEEAFDRAGLAYRAESSSLVYQAAEIRDLLAVVRALADPSDLLACVTALRSALFACGDDDLWTWKRDGGSFSLLAPPDTVREDHPVARGMAYLRDLHRRARWSTPSEVLTAIVVDRRILEVAAASDRRARDQWRRVRFVVDQARAWSDSQHGSLREYAAWAMRQADDSSRVAEAVLPETDLDVVRVMTVHAAKGLEFPMVVLSGLTSQSNNRGGVQIIWPPEGGYSIRLTKRLQTNDFLVQQPLDEQMDAHERRRLLYVGATRAEDHLVVSLHRNQGSTSKTNAKLLADADALTGATHFARAGLTDRPELESAPPEPMPDRETWLAGVTAARAGSRRPSARSASGLEGTDPDAALAVSLTADVTAARTGPGQAGTAALPVEAGAGQHTPGQAKGGRDLELPPWSKGRYGDRVGRAVHGVLQTADLTRPDVPRAAVEAQCLAEGVIAHADAVAGIVGSALASPVVKRAAEREYWCESYVAKVQDDGTVLEGFIDLVYREDDGSLVVVDYKTDSVPDAALPTRLAYYAPQLRAYRDGLATATGADVKALLLFLRPDRPAVPIDVP